MHQTDRSKPAQDRHDHRRTDRAKLTPGPPHRKRQVRHQAGHDRQRHRRTEWPARNKQEAPKPASEAGRRATKNTRARPNSEQGRRPEGPSPPTATGTRKKAATPSSIGQNGHDSLSLGSPAPSPARLVLVAGAAAIDDSESPARADRAGEGFVSSGEASSKRLASAFAPSGRL